MVETATTSAVSLAQQVGGTPGAIILSAIILSIALVINGILSG